MSYFALSLFAFGVVGPVFACVVRVYLRFFSCYPLKSDNCGFCSISGHILCYTGVKGCNRRVNGCFTI